MKIFETGLRSLKWLSDGCKNLKFDKFNRFGMYDYRPLQPGQKITKIGRGGFSAPNFHQFYSE